MKVSKILISLSVFCFGIRLLMAGDVEVGKWRTHFSPSSVLQITQRNDEFFAVTLQELIYVDTRDNSVLEMNIANGLSGTGLSTAAYSPLHDILLVGYNDGRLDFVYGNNDVFTVYDIADKDINDGKAVRHICMEGRYAYLSMPFGVVVVDMRKQEIKETYYIGIDNTPLQVNRISVFQGKIYAATEQGLKYAELSSANLNDYNAWKTDTVCGGNEILYITEAFGHLIVGNEHQVYAGDVEGGWKNFSQLNENEEEFSALSGCADYLAVSITGTAGYGRCVVLNREGLQEFATESMQRITSLKWEENAAVWIGTEEGRLNRLDMKTGRMQSFVLAGPVSNTCFKLSSTGNGVAVAAGGFDGSFVPMITAFGGSLFQDKLWHTYTYRNLVAGGINSNVMSVTQFLEDPFEQGHYYFSSSYRGLVEKTANDKWVLYNAKNSSLQNNRINGLDCRVNAMAFDRSGDLWMVNALSPVGLVCKRRNGEWKSYDLCGAGNSDERPGKIMADYWGTKWVIFNNKELSIFKTEGNSVQSLKVDLNKGNTLRTSSVFCFVEDQLGHVWIGTDRGVKVIDQHARMFDSPEGNETSIRAKTVKVPRDGYLIELLNTDQVKAIAVDGANRKWLGTQGDGIYLVSSDGMEEIHHFTTENSPLLSNNITDIAIYNRTGEVFIGTDKGLISYRGTATVTEGNPKKEARAFPNPVRPGYEGFINVRGLPQNAIVKITDTRGVLIYQGQATGGQLSWDGYALNGKRPNSGVLFVFACAEDGSQKLACKIFYVR